MIALTTEVSVRAVATTAMRKAQDIAAQAGNDGEHYAKGET